jgi:hypothetical protein
MEVDCRICIHCIRDLGKEVVVIYWAASKKIKFAVCIAMNCVISSIDVMLNVLINLLLIFLQYGAQHFQAYIRDRNFISQNSRYGDKNPF